MATRSVIDEFLSHRKLALVRPSRKAPVRGVSISGQLEPNGYSIAVVYLDEIDKGERLSTLKEPVEGVIVAVPPDQSERAVKEAVAAKIPRMWLQQGAESKEAISLGESNGMTVIHGSCILMYAEPVRSVHAFHRWLWKTFGLLAK
jgi:predicted CoA-binding protein